MSGGEVVCEGWLRKSPPEKKLRRYAWKKRWFVLRSGRLTGDPDVLEYYKNDHTKKPIRVIDLNLCEQVDAGLTFSKKDLEHSFIFDIKTIDRVFYLVADTEEEMNKWVRHICDICGFNPTDDDASKAAHQSITGGLVVDTPPHAALGNVGPAASVLSGVPPPYQPVSVQHLNSQSSSDEPQDYLWLANCESKKPEPNSSVECQSPLEGDQEYLLLEECESKTVPPQTCLAHAECSKSTSSETDLNDNLPSHRTPTSATFSAKHISHNGFFPQHPAPASAPSFYDSPPSRGASFSADAGLYSLPRSYSQDTVLLPISASSPPAHTDSGDASELYVFNTPSRKPSIETHMRNISISYDVPPTPGANCPYQAPRTMSLSTGAGGSEGDVVPPPRPPKPSLSSSSGLPQPPAERSPTDTFCMPRPASETDGNYSVPPSAGSKALRSHTIGAEDCSRLRKDFGSQDFYDIPRPFPTDKSYSFDFNENLKCYFKNKGMMPLGSHSTEEVDQNYVPMSANSPSHHHSGSLLETANETNYVPMTPSTVEFPSLGKQVPPPAHMGFRLSPKTPPRRPVLSECQPPPVDRNLKPDRKVRPAPLEIKPSSDWEESCTPVRSPVTRSFTREEESFYCTVPITPVKREVEEVDTIEEIMKLSTPMPTDGGSSPMLKTKGDKQVEYLDLDLESSLSTPPRKMKSMGTGITASDERVDYVVVDQQRTQALKSTREAWSEDRQCSETDTLSKAAK
ncbi:GRB2-associated-binding protein 1 isoform X10 [Oryzias latipes]|uniref:GRB2-associated-binding protein 1 isoform X10 n=1 Tax=Oryzias latipes TaxID=8090 RepID=UPI000CE1DA50|nr:GRB2-associated-binding protein 1 isoform X10 [Oryzias latipes]